MNNNTSNQDVTIKDVFEFLQEHMVMKEDAVIKNDLEDLKQSMNARFAAIDVRLNNLENRMNARFDTIEADLADIKFQLAALEKRAAEDTSMNISDINDLKARIVVIEKRLELQKTQTV